ncbi:MAG: ABC transporter substrate-binding protein [Deltaproteobacteria bacterium]|nr:ABC transporter substrate-binding protein [Deltaproteobacteria bacterium]
MKTKKMLFFLALILITGLPCVGFGAEKPATQKLEPITIGYIQSLTGVAGRMAGTECAMLAVEEINKAGGILGRQVKLLVRDDEFRPASASKVIRELHDQYGVKFFLGITNSGSALALIPYLEQTNSLLITCAAHSTLLTGKKFSSNVFRITDNGGIRARAMAEMARKVYPNVHKWAGFIADYEYGWNCWNNFKKVMTQLDPKFQEATVRALPLTMTSGFGPHFSSVAESGAEGIYISLSLPQSMSFYLEGKAFGILDKLKALLDHNQDARETRAIGKNLSYDLWTGIHWFREGYDNPVSKRFAEAYPRRFGEQLSADTINQGAGSYDGMYAYKHAIEKAGKLDPEAVKKALEGLRFESLCGEKWIRPEDHQALFKIVFHHIVPDPGSKWGFRYKDFFTVDAKDAHVWPLNMAREQ